MIWIHRLCILSVLLIVSSAGAQTTQFGLEMHGARGFLLPHRQNMMHLPMGASHSVDLFLFKQTDGVGGWQGEYNQPRVGIMIKGFDLANKDILGYGLGAALCFSAPVWQSNRFKWYLEMGSGPGFVSKPFNIDKNYKNIAIGSYGNVFIMLGQRFSYRVLPSVQVSIATSFNHFSNAAFALPNLGLNYPTVSAGLIYTPGTLKRTFADSNRLSSHNKQLESFWSVSFGWGIKESIRPFRSKFPIFTLAADRNFALSRKSSFAVGADVFYNVALYNYRNFESETVSALGNTQGGLHLGYGLHIDELHLGIQMGAYVYDTYKQDGPIYHRVALRYYFTDHIGANLSLKTHFFKADYFEAGISYRI